MQEEDRSGELFAADEFLMRHAPME